MTKYAYLFLTGLQGALVYRWNIGLRATFALLHLVFVFSLWTAAFQGQTAIGGHSLGETLTYFVVVFFCNFAIAAWSEDYQIAEEIRNGTINQFLLKPVSYFAYRLSLFFASRVVTSIITLGPMVLVLPLIGPHLDLPSEAWRWGLGALSLLLAALLQFSVAYLFGLLAFWFLDIQGFVILSLALETLLSGQLFPLDLAPPPFDALLRYQPFYYMMYFPVGILTGRIGLEEAWAGLPVQVFWVVAGILVCQAVWQRGLGRHTAVGG